PQLLEVRTRGAGRSTRGAARRGSVDLLRRGAPLEQAARLNYTSLWRGLFEAMSDLEARVLEQTWFYRFRLPSGALTRSYDDGALDQIHETRLRMMERALADSFPDGLGGRSAVNLACHQG